MASWATVRQSEPRFAGEVERRFDKYTHKVLATLKKDGSPRVSGIEAEFRDGEVWLGMMPGSLKAMDLRRDARMALHSGTEDPGEAPSPGVVFDAKISGRAVEVREHDSHSGQTPDQPHRFRVDIDEVVLVALGEPADHLVIKVWTPTKGLKEVQRY